MIGSTQQLPGTRLDSLFRGRRVLVTGHTGFKGAWLSAWLVEMGAEVFGLSLKPPTTPSLFEQIDLAGKVDHRIGDIRDAESLAVAVAQIRPEVVFHLAAQSLVRHSYEDPLGTLGTNIMGTAHLLESIRRCGRPCVAIGVTSDKCYENRDGVYEFTEEDPLGGHDPYSASKGAAEIVISAYRNAFFPVQEFHRHGVALASVRAGNVIGGGDWARDRILPDIIRALDSGKQVEVRNPSAVRPWQHVLDALSGYLCLAARMLEDGPEGLAEAWNFGPLDDRVITVAELVESVHREWGGGEFRRVEQEERVHEAAYLRLSSEKAVARLGWRPAFDLEQTVRATVSWYKAAKKSEALYPFTVEQVGDYVSRAQRAKIGWAVV